MTAAPTSPLVPVRHLAGLPASTDRAGRPVDVFVLTEDGELLCSDPDRLPALAERLGVLLRPEVAAAPPDVLRLGRLALEPEAYSATVAGRRVALTPREFELLFTLARSAGRTLTREFLLQTPVVLARACGFGWDAAIGGADGRRWRGRGEQRGRRE